MMSIRIDKVLTPPGLARKMVSLVKGRRRRPIIADFAVGEGALLVAALRRWPKARIYATDVRRYAIRRLRASNPRWKVGVCDFLKRDSRDGCAVLREAKGRVGIALLNPPFSCRGGTRMKVELAGAQIACSVGMAFVLEAVLHLRRGGEMLAVLPAGSVTSERDRCGWSTLRGLAEVSIGRVNGRKTFAGCNAQTVLVHVRRRRTHEQASPIKELGDRVAKKRVRMEVVELVRGSVQMHRLDDVADGKRAPLVHTTDLAKGAVSVVQRVVPERCRGLQGPAVLIPRVGLPDPEKVCVYVGRRKIVLSDCVVGMRCRSVQDARAIRSELLKSWPAFRREYDGTGAPYITIAKIEKALLERGIEVGGEVVQGRRMLKVS